MDLSSNNVMAADNVVSLGPFFGGLAQDVNFHIVSTFLNLNGIHVLCGVSHAFQLIVATLKENPTQFFSPAQGMPMDDTHNLVMASLRLKSPKHDILFLNFELHVKAPTDLRRVTPLLVRLIDPLVPCALVVVRSSTPLIPHSKIAQEVLIFNRPTKWGKASKHQVNIHYTCNRLFMVPPSKIINGGSAVCVHGVTIEVGQRTTDEMSEQIAVTAEQQRDCEIQRVFLQDLLTHHLGESCAKVSVVDQLQKLQDEVDLWTRVVKSRCLYLRKYMNHLIWLDQEGACMFRVCAGARAIDVFMLFR